MIVSFLDKDFKGLQNNASLIVDKNSYNLVKRPIELNELSCVCEPFNEDIQPTFLVVKDNIGGYVYGCLAGIPQLTKDNKTQIVGTDLKTLLSSDIILSPSTYSSVNDYIKYIFNEWENQVNQNSFTCELSFNENVGNVPFDELVPTTDKRVVDALEELKPYLKKYNFFIDTKLDLINKKVVFIIGRTMVRKLNIRLWDYGIKQYGKWIASVNETQGYYENDGNYTAGTKWILTSQNQITSSIENRDIYPIKKKIIVNNESLLKANIEALMELIDYTFNEDIEINAVDFSADFETRFEVYTDKGKGKYKDLPCGALYYNSFGLVKVQIGYRYTTVDFI